MSEPSMGHLSPLELDAELDSATPDALPPDVVAPHAIAADDALDIQHDTDPADDYGPAKRIPNLGHALSFFALSFFLLEIAAVVCFLAAGIRDFDQAPLHPGLALLAQAISYVLTLLLSLMIFPRFWQRSFVRGIEWNALAAERRWFWLVPAALVMSVLAQFADHFVKAPDSNLMQQLMHTAKGAWGVTAFGILLAPLTEEIGFRGFLLPALATAYDWLALDRTPQGLRQWESTTTHTTPALIFGAIFSSIPFALIHSGQLHHAWGALSVILGVSLVLSYVRVKTHSVACSTLMHACYNASLFAIVIFQTGGFRHLDKLR